MFNITYHDFGYTGNITLISGCIVTLYVINYVRREYARTSRVSLSDVLGIISWEVLAFLPVVGVALCIVISIQLFISKMVDIMFNADSIILFQRKKDNNDEIV